MSKLTSRGDASTAARWRQQVAAWRRSGMTAAQFARERELAESTLRWWAWRLKRDAKVRRARRAGETMSLVPVRVVDVADHDVEVARGDAGPAVEPHQPLWTLRTARGELSVFAADGAEALRAAVVALIGGGGS
jgi:transposase